MKTAIHYAMGIIFSICLMITLLFTSAEMVLYWIPGYFEREYVKYHVPESVGMTMDDLLHVTSQMMAYLRGMRPDLHIATVIGGLSREFFNAREIAHMADVRSLFLGALSIRRGCLLIMAICLILMFLLKTNKRRILPKAVCLGSGLFLCCFLILAAIISTDFSTYFVMFHKIFFHNALWILDPATDMLIDIVPEGFFSDTALYIGAIFFSFVLAIFGLMLFILRKFRGK